MIVANLADKIILTSTVVSLVRKPPVNEKQTNMYRYCQNLRTKEFTGCTNDDISI